MKHPEFVLALSLATFAISIAGCVYQKSFKSIILNYFVGILGLGLSLFLLVPEEKKTKAIYLVIGMALIVASKSVFAFALKHRRFMAAGTDQVNQEVELKN